MASNVVKQKFGLTTDKASDLKSALYAFAAAILAMPEGSERTWLIGAWLAAMAVISYLQVGNIRPELAKELQESLGDKE